MNDPEPALEPRPRLQRPAAARQAPLRRPPLGLPVSVSAAMQQGLDGSRAVAGAAEAGMQGFVERGVDTAYTVIDAYLRRGQQAAQRVSPGAPETAGPLSGLAGLGRLGGLGGLGATLAASTPWGATASSITGPWLQLLRAWADALATLGPLAGRAGAGLGDALPPGFMAAGEAAHASVTGSEAAVAAPAAAPMAAAGPRAKVTIELVSRRTAEVAVSLEPGADLAALQADWLTPPAGPAAAAPGSLTLYNEPGHVHLRLALADPPPPGRHEAHVTDSLGQAWGSVVVTIARNTAA